MKPHKWAKEIHAWADGAEIEMWLPISEAWVRVAEPFWDGANYEFRIKQQFKEPEFLYVFKHPHNTDLIITQEDGLFLGNPIIGKIPFEKV